MLELFFAVWFIPAILCFLFLVLLDYSKNKFITIENMFGTFALCFAFGGGPLALVLAFVGIMNYMMDY